MTAARSQEVLKARWSEIDLDNAIWTIPGPRMKMCKEHRVPLACATVGLLRSLYHEDDGDGYLFIGTQPGQPLGHTALSALVKRMGRDVTVHGFRSAFRDWAGETTAFSADVCEAALAHIKGKVERAYQRGDLFDKRRRLMEVWATYCGTSQAPSATVTPIRGASR